jgi:hydrogenase expression/formation protein HypE
MQLQCPIPQTDFDVITLGHGSGGQLTSRLLDTLVFSQLTNPELEKRHDGAILQLDGKLAFSTDSYVVSPIFFPGGNIGDLAINGTVNDLAMCGALPQYLSLSFIIEEGLPVSEFWEVIQSIKQAALKANISIVTGDTKVVEKGKGDKLFINTSGIGSIHPKAQIDVNRVVTGDVIIVSNKIAHHGMAIMSIREGLTFESNISTDSRPLSHVCMKCLDEFGESIKVFRDPTRGGVATTLTEIAESSGKGIFIQEKNINLDPSVEGACEMLGLDPLYVANEGVFIAIVDASNADDLLQFLKQQEETAFAFKLGEVTDAYEGKVVLESKMRGKRVLTKLIGDQLPRIC